jgi:hypothetical protein
MHSAPPPHPNGLPLGLPSLRLPQAVGRQVATLSEALEGSNLRLRWEIAD